jgi:hypothetical protein
MRRWALVALVGLILNQTFQDARTHRPFFYVIFDRLWMNLKSVKLSFAI